MSCLSVTLERQGGDLSAAIARQGGDLSASVSIICEVIAIDALLAAENGYWVITEDGYCVQVR